MILTREQIFAQNDLPTEDVSVPEWGGTVRVRTITAGERDAFEASTVSHADGKATPRLENMRARLVSIAATNEAGQLLFTEDDVYELSRKNARAVDRVFEVARRLAGMGKDTGEELRGN